MKVAIIRIRGLPNVKSGIADAMKFLGLNKKHTCVIVEETKDNKAAIQKIANYTTYGPVNEETLKLLEEKRGKTAKKNEYKTVYFLAPPRKGFEKGGIKKAFAQGGALGNRAEKINDLIARMI